MNQHVGLGRHWGRWGQILNTGHTGFIWPHNRGDTGTRMEPPLAISKDFLAFPTDAPIKSNVSNADKYVLNLETFYVVSVFSRITHAQCC